VSTFQFFMRSSSGAMSNNIKSLIMNDCGLSSG
jgi:hypothetical protein